MVLQAVVLQARWVRVLGLELQSGGIRARWVRVLGQEQESDWSVEVV